MNAAFGRRFAAFVYDALLIAALLMVFTAVAMILTHGHAITVDRVGRWVLLYRAGLVAVVAAYFCVTCVRTGNTLGMRAWRLRLVRRDGGRPGYGRALWRFAMAVPSWLICGLGTLWLYLDSEGLAAQDRLSGTRVEVLANFAR